MKTLRPLIGYTVAIVALALTAAAYMRPDMVVAAWGVLGLCFS